MSTQSPDTPSTLDTPVVVGASPGASPDPATGPLDLLAITLTVDSVPELGTQSGCGQARAA